MHTDWRYKQWKSAHQEINFIWLCIKKLNVFKYLDNILNNFIKSLCPLFEIASWSCNTIVFVFKA